MNTVEHSTEVTEFVSRVRALLADLEPEERRDITDGLEADLADLVAERGGGALGDPAHYARELRTAAGLTPDMAEVPRARPLGQKITVVLDSAHSRWTTLVSGLPGDPWGLAQVLRPVWWVLRAWVALECVDLIWGNGLYNFGLAVIPTLHGLGLPLLLIAVLVSVQIGRGKLWPGAPTSGAFARVLLLLLNVLAIALTPLMFINVITPARADAIVGTASPVNGYEQGMYVDGHWVSQMYPYDAAGHPLVGVQLFDQTGQPVNVATTTECVYDSQGNPIGGQGRVYYPWTNGAAQVHNVFPVPSVVAGQDVPDPDPEAFQRSTKPSIGQFPSPQVPSVTLPHLIVSSATTPSAAYAPGVRPVSPINPIDGC